MPNLRLHALRRGIFISRTLINIVVRSIFIFLFISRTLINIVVRLIFSFVSFPLSQLHESLRAGWFSFLALARDARQSIWHRLKSTRSVADLGVIVLDFLHELAKASCHRVLLAIDAEASVVCPNVDLAALDNVAPVIQRVFDCEELALLCRIALLRFGELFGFKSDRVKTNLSIWIAEGLLKDCADAV
jgi:hypothetical protein